VNATPEVPTLAAVCAAALDLPASPAVLPRLMAVLAAADSSADDLAEIILLDPPLAAATLRLANSAAFGPHARAHTLAHAVLRLGQRELYRLATLAVVNRWDTDSGRYGEPGDFCRQALCTALAAEALAEIMGQVDPHAAYTAGLICDFGHLAVAHACWSFFPRLRASCLEQRWTWSQAERAVLGYTHSEVGARLLDTWRFPPVLAAVAGCCESPRGAPAAALPLLAHVHGAKYIAASFGPGVAEGGFRFELDTAFLLERGFTAEILQTQMVVVCDRATALLRGKLTHGALRW
jgi:HD-like signal output (HDOD) protein